MCWKVSTDDYLTTYCENTYVRSNNLLVHIDISHEYKRMYLHIVGW
jgi:hypothetical protein